MLTLGTWLLMNPQGVLVKPPYTNTTIPIVVYWFQTGYWSFLRSGSCNLLLPCIFGSCVHGSLSCEYVTTSVFGAWCFPVPANSNSSTCCSAVSWQLLLGFAAKKTIAVLRLIIAGQNKWLFRRTFFVLIPSSFSLVSVSIETCSAPTDQIPLFSSLIASITV